MQKFSSHRQKKYSRQIIVYGTLFAFFVIFLSTIGLKLLINGTIFITNLTNPEKKERGVENLMTPPEITIPSATNSASLQISGKADPKKDLRIFVNDELQHESFLTEENYEAIITLLEGDNSVYAELEDPKTHKKALSQTYSVRYISTKPKLDIYSPVSPAKVYKEEIVVEGQTDRDMGVVINGSPAVVGADGKFRESLRLTEGENKITVSAIDTAGNVETKEILVTYERD